MGISRLFLQGLIFNARNSFLVRFIHTVDKSYPLNS